MPSVGRAGEGVNRDRTPSTRKGDPTKMNKVPKLPNNGNNCNVPCFREIGTMEAYINTDVIERVGGAASVFSEKQELDREVRTL